MTGQSSKGKYPAICFSFFFLFFFYQEQEYNKLHTAIHTALFCYSSIFFFAINLKIIQKSYDAKLLKICNEILFLFKVQKSSNGNNLHPKLYIHNQKFIRFLKN